MISLLLTVTFTDLQKTLKYCKGLSVAFVLLSDWCRREHFLCIGSLSFSPHPPRSADEVSGNGPCQAAHHGPAGSCCLGCVYHTLFYRGHCFGRNEICSQWNGSSDSTSDFFQRKRFSFLPSISILAKKASKLVPKWSSQAERGGRAFTIWNWSILSVLVGKCVREKKN